MRTFEYELTPATKLRRRWILAGVISMLIIGYMIPPLRIVPGDSDGLRYLGKKYISARLKDPRSVQWVSTSKPVKAGNRYVMRFTYRAKNSFGGYVIESRLCYQDGDTGSIVTCN